MKQDINPWQLITVYVIMTILVLLILLPSKCAAQTVHKIDTVNCKIECIQEIIVTTTDSGKHRMHAIYKDKSANVEEIISISKTVVDYIEMCKKHGITPSLGIRLRDGIITSIIRIKPKYTKKWTK